MDFGDILDAWDKGEGRRAAGRRRRPGGSDRRSEPDPGQMERDDWLELYPPGEEDIRGDDPRPPVSGPGRKTLVKSDPEAVLDLHGHKGRDVPGELEAFVRSCRRKGVRKALVIHGKGNHSPGGSVLKPLVRRWLADHPFVGETGTPGRRHGGSGATWFLLKEGGDQRSR